MKALALLLILAATTAYGVRNLEVRKRFLVKELKGKVLAWPPLAPAWQELNVGDPILEDTLIQVQKNASITFELSAQQGFSGLQAESMIITLNSPILMRLRENIPRRVTLNDYFIPKIPEAKPDKSLAELFYENFAEAWERFAANLLPQAIRNSLFKRALEGDSADTAVSLRAKRIKIYTPAQGALSITSSLPEEMRISWQSIAETHPPYAVRLWEVDKPRPPPMALTTQDYYVVKITKEGNYLTQVATEDGRWQSEVRAFSVLLPMNGRGEPPSLTHVNLPLPLKLPPKNFVFFSKELPLSVVFEWDRPNAAQGRQTYTFILSDTNGKELFRRNTSDLIFSMKFTNPGTYRWYVVATPATVDPENPSHIFSEVRTISVQASKKIVAGKTDPIEELFLVRADRIFYLDSW